MRIRTDIIANELDESIDFDTYEYDLEFYANMPKLDRDSKKEMVIVSDNSDDEEQ